MIRILYRHRSTGIVDELPLDKLEAAVQDKQLTLWVDMLDPSEAEWRHIYSDIFHFHQLAIEDAVVDSHLPKLDDFNTFLFLVVHTVRLGDERMDLHTHEIDIFLGLNYLVTTHVTSSAALDRMFQPEYHKTSGLAKGPAFTLYELLDRQVDAYIPLVEEFEERIEVLGDAIFRSTPASRVATLNDLLTAKSTALRLRRFLIPQRETINRLATLEYGVVPAETRIYFRDVYDHMVRLADLADGTRDLVDATIETHLALANNRMNEVMKVLTIISSIFIPLTFLAGVYGMNFDFMPELHWKWAYPAIWIIFVVIAALLYLTFRRWGWLRSEADDDL